MFKLSLLFYFVAIFTELVAICSSTSLLLSLLTSTKDHKVRNVDSDNNDEINASNNSPPQKLALMHDKYVKSPQDELSLSDAHTTPNEELPPSTNIVVRKNFSLPNIPWMHKKQTHPRSKNNPTIVTFPNPFSHSNRVKKTNNDFMLPSSFDPSSISSYESSEPSVHFDIEINKGNQELNLGNGMQNLEENIENQLGHLERNPKKKNKIKFWKKWRHLNRTAENILPNKFGEPAISNQNSAEPSVHIDITTNEGNRGINSGNGIRNSGVNIGNDFQDSTSIQRGTNNKNNIEENSGNMNSNKGVRISNNIGEHSISNQEAVDPSVHIAITSNVGNLGINLGNDIKTSRINNVHSSQDSIKNHRGRNNNTNIEQNWGSKNTNKGVSISNRSGLLSIPNQISVEPSVHIDINKNDGNQGINSGNGIRNSGVNIANSLGDSILRRRGRNNNTYIEENWASINTSKSVSTSKNFSKQTISKHKSVGPTVNIGITNNEGNQGINSGNGIKNSGVNIANSFRSSIPKQGGRNNNTYIEHKWESINTSKSVSTSKNFSKQTISKHKSFEPTVNVGITNNEDNQGINSGNGVKNTGVNIANSLGDRITRQRGRKNNTYIEKNWGSINTSKSVSTSKNFRKQTISKHKSVEPTVNIGITTNEGNQGIKSGNGVKNTGVNIANSLGDRITRQRGRNNNTYIEQNWGSINASKSVSTSKNFGKQTTSKHKSVEPTVNSGITNNEGNQGINSGNGVKNTGVNIANSLGDRISRQRGRNNNTNIEQNMGSSNTSKSVSTSNNSGKLIISKQKSVEPTVNIGITNNEGNQGINSGNGVKNTGVNIANSLGDRITKQRGRNNNTNFEQNRRSINISKSVSTSNNSGKLIISKQKTVEPTVNIGITNNEGNQGINSGNGVKNTGINIANSLGDRITMQRGRNNNTNIEQNMGSSNTSKSVSTSNNSGKLIISKQKSVEPTVNIGITNNEGNQGINSGNGVKNTGVNIANSLGDRITKQRGRNNNTNFEQNRRSINISKSVSTSNNSGKLIISKQKTVEPTVNIGITNNEGNQGINSGNGVKNTGINIANSLGDRITMQRGRNNNTNIEQNMGSSNTSKSVSTSNNSGKLIISKQKSVEPTVNIGITNNEGNQGINSGNGVKNTGVNIANSLGDRITKQRGRNNNTNFEQNRRSINISKSVSTSNNSGKLIISKQKTVEPTVNIGITNNEGNQGINSGNGVKNTGINIANSLGDRITMQRGRNNNTNIEQNRGSSNTSKSVSTSNNSGKLIISKQKSVEPTVNIGITNNEGNQGINSGNGVKNTGVNIASSLGDRITKQRGRNNNTNIEQNRRSSNTSKSVSTSNNSGKLIISKQKSVEPTVNIGITNNEGNQGINSGNGVKNTGVNIANSLGDRITKQRGRNNSTNIEQNRGSSSTSKSVSTSNNSGKLIISKQKSVEPTVNIGITNNEGNQGINSGNGVKNTGANISNSLGDHITRQRGRNNNTNIEQNKGSINTSKSVSNSNNFGKLTKSKHKSVEAIVNTDITNNEGNQGINSGNGTNNTGVNITNSLGHSIPKQGGTNNNTNIEQNWGSKNTNNSVIISNKFGIISISTQKSVEPALDMDITKNQGNQGINTGNGISNSGVNIANSFRNSIQRQRGKNNNTNIIQNWGSTNSIKSVSISNKFGILSISIQKSIEPSVNIDITKNVGNQGINSGNGRKNSGVIIANSLGGSIPRQRGTNNNSIVIQNWGSMNTNKSVNISNNFGILSICNQKSVEPSVNIGITKNEGNQGANTGNGINNTGVNIANNLGGSTPKHKSIEPTGNIVVTKNQGNQGVNSGNGINNTSVNIANNFGDSIPKHKSIEPTGNIAVTKNQGNQGVNLGNGINNTGVNIANSLGDSITRQRGTNNNTNTKQNWESINTSKSVSISNNYGKQSISKHKSVEPTGNIDITNNEGNHGVNSGNGIKNTGVNIANNLGVSITRRETNNNSNTEQNWSSINTSKSVSISNNYGKQSIIKHKSVEPTGNIAITKNEGNQGVNSGIGINNAGVNMANSSGDSITKQQSIEPTGNIPITKNEGNQGVNSGNGINNTGVNIANSLGDSIIRQRGTNNNNKAEQNWASINTSKGVSISNNYGKQSISKHKSVEPTGNIAITKNEVNQGVNSGIGINNAGVNMANSSGDSITKQQSIEPTGNIAITKNESNQGVNSGNGINNTGVNIANSLGDSIIRQRGTNNNTKAEQNWASINTSKGVSISNNYGKQSISKHKSVEPTGNIAITKNEGNQGVNSGIGINNAGVNMANSSGDSITKQQSIEPTTNIAITKNEGNQGVNSGNGINNTGVNIANSLGDSITRQRGTNNNTKTEQNWASINTSKSVSISNNYGKQSISKPKSVEPTGNIAITNDEINQGVYSGNGIKNTGVNIASNLGVSILKHKSIEPTGNIAVTKNQGNQGINSGNGIRNSGVNIENSPGDSLSKHHGPHGNTNMEQNWGSMNTNKGVGISSKEKLIQSPPTNNNRNLELNLKGLDSSLHFDILNKKRIIRPPPIISIYSKKSYSWRSSKTLPENINLSENSRSMHSNENFGITNKFRQRSKSSYVNRAVSAY